MAAGDADDAADASLPARGAWVEIILGAQALPTGRVAPRTGSVG